MRRSTIARYFSRSFALGLFGFAACQDFDRITPPSASDASRATGAQPQPDLFLNLQTSRSGLDTRQQRILSGIQNRAEAIEIHIAQLATDPQSLLQRGRSVGIRVSPTKQYVAVGEEAAVDDLGIIFWSGRLQGEPGDITISVGTGVWGDLRTATDHYDFRSIGDGLVAVSRVDLSRIGPLEPGTSELTALNHICAADNLTLRSLADQTSISNEIPPLPTASANSAQGTPIDIYLLRTAAAHDSIDDLNAFHNNVLNVTNQSYANSNISINVRRAYSGKVNGYNELNRTLPQQVEDLADRADGRFDWIHTHRDAKLADVTVLFTVGALGANNAGRACQIMANAASAFAVLDYNIATSIHAFAHEIGHLQGARHHNDPNNSPFPYGHAYVHPNQGWRTLMHTNGSNLRFWSNPNVSHPTMGSPMGTTGSNNNARVLNETRQIVENFRRPLMISVTGPTTVIPNQLCIWIAQAIGGNPPFSYEWRVNGVLKGTASGFSWRFPESSGLSVTVTDEDDRTSGWGSFITVDPNGPHC